MIEPILTLAMSMHANPGVYALLLGSGVSRAAKIPTGWEVVLDLAGKLAKLLGEDCEPDAAAWYRSKFGRDPDYAELLDAIGKTPAERAQLLRSYFEPDADEREQDFKQPTQAHRAIAKLVANGYCRLILTTNFDKLIERAIEDEGISPTVISTADAVEGALPLVHQRCCVIKLHGDYLDVRIKNTPAELAEYDPRMNRLLDQVLDQFGLIVCGWSAQWDAALRAALERCPTRRFSMFWAARERLLDEAQRLVNLRAAQVIRTQDADSFFGRLAELVAALTASQRPHPVSVQAAVALVKRYSVDPRHRAELEDLVHNETETAHQRVEAYSEEVLALPQSKTKTADAFRRYREIVELLQAVLIHGAAQGTTQHDRLWVTAVERIGRYEKQSGTVLKGGIRQYPTVVLLYSCGIAAVVRGRVELLARLLTEPRLRRHGESQPMLLGIEWGEMHEFTKTIEEHQRQYVPLSEKLFAELREPLRRYVPDDDEYEESFDRFEYVRSLVYADIENDALSADARLWAPPGRFCWKARRDRSSIIVRIGQEMDALGNEWPLLKTGLFRGSLERAQAVKQGVDAFVSRLQMF